MMLQPDPRVLLDRLAITRPLLAVYDAPDAAVFEPLVRPPTTGHGCVFARYRQFLEGQTLLLTRDQFGCGGAGRCFLGLTTRPREAFLKFLAEDEGLKDSVELMAQWLDHGHTYSPTHDNVLVGPLVPARWPWARAVTFLVDADQLSALMIGAQYHAAPSAVAPVIAPFGAGCGLLLPFSDLEVAQAAIGATDIAMRQYLPKDVLAFTVTRSMFARLCALDERSFLFKPFLERLKQARARQAQRTAAAGPPGEATPNA